MGSRFTTKKPEYVYYWGSGKYLNGPYVNPQKGRDCVKYKLTEVEKFDAKEALLEIFKNQVMDLSLMSKIELGDDVIAEINRLNKIINSNE